MEKLEEKLVKESWISSEQFLKAKEEQAKLKKSIFPILIKSGYLKEEDIYLFFSRHTQIPFINIFDYQVNEELIKLFPEELYREHLFIPLFKIENTLYTGMANPFDTEFIDNLKMRVNLDIHPLFASPSSILKTLNQFFGPDDRWFKDVANLLEARATLNLPFWRESERIPVELPVEFKPCDKRIKLAFSDCIPATASDISSSGKAIGIKTRIFIPPKIQIIIKFPSKDPSYEGKAEVVHCNVSEKSRYLLGAKFIEIKDELIKSIVEEAKKKQII